MQKSPGAWVSVLVLPLVALSLAVAPPKASAHERGDFGPWCGPVTAYTPYRSAEDPSVLGNVAFLGCNDLVRDPIEMHFSGCLQWYDPWTGEAYDVPNDSTGCFYWHDWGTSAHRWLTWSCLTGHWRMTAFATWWLDGHWHDSSDVSAWNWINCN